jgi:hypothetical protein
VKAIGYVAAAAIAEQQDLAGVGVVLATVLFPPMGDAVATELAGIVAGVEVDMTLVVRQVVKAVRDQLALAYTGKIMLEHLGRRLCQGMTVAGNIAAQFSFPGIDAHHGIRRQILGLEFGNVLKPRIPIRMRTQRLLLAHLARGRPPLSVRAGGLWKHALS